MAAKEQVSNSDFSGWMYHGTLAMKGLPEFAGAAESMTL